MSRKQIFGMCNPILDIILKTTDEKLLDLGLEIGSNTLGKDKEVFKFINNIISGNEDINFIIGGSLLNSLRVCKNLSKYDNNEENSLSILFSGGISDDSGGILLQELLTEEEIDYEFHISNKENLETGKCLVFVTNKERTLLVGLGSAKEYSISTFESDKVQSFIKNSFIIATSGYFVEVCYDAVFKAAVYSNKMSNNKCFFIFGLSAVYIVDKYIKEIYNLFQMIDYLIGNEEEFISLYKSLNKLLNLKYLDEFNENKNNNLDDVLMEKILLEIHQYLKSSCTILCTRGPKPVISLNRELRKANNLFFKYYKCIEIPEDKLVDFNGCGDAFEGGFIYGLSNSYPLDASIYMGHYAASIVAQNIGCSFDFSNKPSFEELISLISNQN